MPTASSRASIGGRSRLPAGCLLAALLAAGCGTGHETAVGTIERDRIEIVAEAFEPVEAILVREGQDVAAGAALVVLDGSAAGTRLRQAEAASARAVARLAEIERGPREEDIRGARARLAGAEASLAVRRRDLDRAAALARRGSAPDAEHDLARATHDAALAERDRARALLDALAAGATPEERAQARAAAAEAEAAVATARLHQERLVLRAPRAGRIDALPFEVGERPPIGAVVAVILAAGAPYARVYVPAALRARVREGSSARVQVDGVEHAYDGRVRAVAADAAFTPYFALTERDRGRLAYLAEIDLLEPRAAELPSGLPAEARFPDAE